MKIYAIRDQMIDYFLQPIIGKDDWNVMASLAELVNGANEHAITQTPKHFELWSLGEIKEDGTVIGQKVFICGCTDLVREGVREDRERREAARQEAARSRQGTAPGNPGQDHPYNGNPPGEAHTAPGANRQAHTRSGRVPREPTWLGRLLRR